MAGKIPNYLMPTRVRVLKPTATRVDGVLQSSYAPVAGLENLRCRIEVNYLRPNKDVLLPAQAGRTPDRVAVYWIDPGVTLKEGYVLQCIKGPVTGAWQVRTAPDPAVDMRSVHHLEGQLLEVSPAVLGGMKGAGT